MGKDSRLNPTLRRVLVATAAVIGLTLVILGMSAISSARKPADTLASTTQLSREARADVFAERALAAEGEEDTATARSLAQSALKLNTANPIARDVIRRLDAGIRTARPVATAPNAPNAAPAPVPAPVGSDAWDKPVASVAGLLPATVEGWEAGTVVEQGSDALVTFTPAEGTADGSSAVRATFSVHDRGSATKASTFVSSVIRKVYPGDGSVVRIGVANGYFGTDGSRLAVAAFARGRFAFEVVVYSQQGIRPSTLRSTALKLASSLPAAR